MDWLDALQWPAMAVTVVATWLVGCQSPRQRKAGFWLFLLSNLLWAAWGSHTHAWALVLLQFTLAILNVRGQSNARKGRRAEVSGERPKEVA